MLSKSIQDIVKKIGGLGFVETLKVTGTDTETKIEAIDKDKTVIVKAQLTEVAPELKGTFGVSSLPLLGGLLNFPSYNTDDATFSVKRRPDNSAPEEFEFRDANGMGSNFRLMSGALAPEQPTVAQIKWDVTFTPTKSKLQEFGTLAGLYSSIDQLFTVKTEGTNLVVCIGEEGATTHNAKMVLAEDITGEIKGDVLWPIAQFQSILKMCDGLDYTVSITGRGAMLISMATKEASYEYIMPARRR